MVHITIQHEKLSTSDRNNIINLFAFTYKGDRKTFSVDAKKYLTRIKIDYYEELLNNCKKILDFYKQYILNIHVRYDNNLIIYKGSISRIEIENIEEE